VVLCRYAIPWCGCNCRQRLAVARSTVQYVQHARAFTSHLL